MAKKSQHQPNASEWPCEIQSLRQFRLPKKGRKRDREFHARRKILLEHPQFRKAITAYRKAYPPSYWEQVPSLLKDKIFGQYQEELIKACTDVMKRYKKRNMENYFSVTAPFVSLRSRTDAVKLCKAFGLDEGDFPWIRWLAQNWDPEKLPMPQGEPQNILPDFDSWKAVGEAAAYPGNWQPRKAILTLWPGVSQTSAIDGAKQAWEFLKGNSNAGGQPALTDEEESTLNKLFARYHTDKLNRKDIINFVFHETQAKGLHVGHSTVASKYRSWLVKEKKGSLKKYETKEERN